MSEEARSATHRLRAELRGIRPAAPPSETSLACHKIKDVRQGGWEIPLGTSAVSLDSSTTDYWYYFFILAGGPATKVLRAKADACRIVVGKARWYYLGKVPSSSGFSQHPETPTQLSCMQSFTWQISTPQTLPVTSHKSQQVSTK